MNTTPASKEAVVLKLLSEGDTMLCLDARHPDACVPPHQAGNPALRLILNRQFPHPIDVSEEGIGVNLSFGGRRFECYIPMDALWAAFNPDTMEGTMWQESASPEVLEGLKAQMQAQRIPKRLPPGPARRARRQCLEPMVRRRPHDTAQTGASATGEIT